MASFSGTKIPIIVGVSGPICSGKTTLANALARELNFAAISESTLGTQYIGDLHAHPERWALEAQVAFLVAKALSVHRSINGSYHVVLDRTFVEDREIFAHYFAAKGIISSRSLQTYESTFSASTFHLPEPRVIVMCSVSLNTTIERMSQRNDAKKSLPHEFVSDIHRRYLSWKLKPAARGTTIQVDSELLDWRNPSIAADIARKVRNKLNEAAD